jgi:hypothetical protein
VLWKAFCVRERELHSRLCQPDRLWRKHHLGTKYGSHPDKSIIAYSHNRRLRSPLLELLLWEEPRQRWGLTDHLFVFCSSSLPGHHGSGQATLALAGVGFPWGGVPCGVSSRGPPFRGTTGLAGRCELLSNLLSKLRDLKLLWRGLSKRCPSSPISHHEALSVDFLTAPTLSSGTGRSTFGQGDRAGGGSGERAPHRLPTHEEGISKAFSRSLLPQYHHPHADRSYTFLRCQPTRLRTS